ncbi:MAG: hypothetical protein FWG68_12480 [Defluviitaleaceae bacterium]|nr:hypothetical protein [Defluviitaleaceae bacterium]
MATKEKNSNANRELKDSVFKMLLEHPEKLAELLTALMGIPFTADEIQLFSLNMTISGSLYNDLGMIVRGRLIVLVEHMSSPYLNMPLRMFLYLAESYERLIKQLGEKRFKYNSKLYKIPTPQFVVFYNGKDKRPEKEILRLSDAFMEERKEVDREKLGNLELEVVVYNINKGYNAELMAKCPTLRQYSDFIAKIREYEELYNDYNKAVREAIEYCIANDILADFLKKNGGKIVSVLFAEFNLDDAKEVWREEGVEDGIEKGRKEGIEEGIEKGIEKGIVKGRVEGRVEGREEARVEERTSFAKMLIRDKTPIDKIIKYTKFTYDEIKRLTAEG